MSPEELHAILRKARALVADARQWTGRNFAEDDAGQWVPVGSQRAARFNLAGAVTRSAGSTAHEAISALEALLAPAPHELNSGRLTRAQGLTRPEALTLLDWAMARLEQLSSEPPVHPGLLEARRRRSTPTPTFEGERTSDWKPHRRAR